MAGDNDKGRIITGPGGVKTAGPGLHPAIIEAIVHGRTPRVTIDIAIGDDCVQKVSGQLQELHKQATELLATMERAIAKAKELKDMEVGKDAVQPKGPARVA